jgi:hypothetical protein
VPVVFFPALKENVVRRDSLLQYTISAETCLATLQQERVSIEEELKWKEQQAHVSSGLLAVANGQLEIERKSALTLSKRVQGNITNGAKKLEYMRSKSEISLASLQQERVSIEQKLKWKDQQAHVSSGLLALANGYLEAEKKKVLTLSKCVEACKIKGAKTLYSIAEASIAVVESERQLREMENKAAIAELVKRQRDKEATENKLENSRAKVERERKRYSCLEADFAALTDEISELQSAKEDNRDSNFASNENLIPSSKMKVVPEIF